MSDPIVAKVVDKGGVERWGAVDAPWVAKGLQDGSLNDPATAQPPTQVVVSSKEAAGAAPVPADGDGKDPRPAKR